MASNELENAVEDKGAESADVKLKSPSLSVQKRNKRLNYPKNAQYHGTGKLPCPDLGDGWTIEQIVRQQGKSAGKYDTYYYSPSGDRIRSKLKLQEYTDKDLSDFDYNSGKLVKKDHDDENVLATKQKMSLLKTEELKTIDRQSPPKTVIPKKYRAKGPYAALVKSYEKRKKRQKLKKGRRKELSTTEAIQRAIEIVEKDSVEQEPFDLFRQEAMSLVEHFPEINGNFQDLVVCAWNFLSLESKLQFSRRDSSSSVAATNLSPTDLAIPTLSSSNDTEIFLKESHSKKKKRKKRRHSENQILCSSPTAKRKRCGICVGCTAKNCGECTPCKDMKKFGGTGCKKQSCVKRKCEALHSPGSPVSMVSQSFFNPFSFPQPFLGPVPTIGGQGPSTLPLDNNGPVQMQPRQRGASTFKIPGASCQDNDTIRTDQATLSNLERDTKQNANGMDSNLSLPTALNQENIVGETSHFNTSSSSNNSMDSSLSSEQHSPHKYHKRKSRVPVYIRRVSEKHCEAGQ